MYASRAGVEAAGLQDRVRAVLGSMDALPFGPEEFDIYMKRVYPAVADAAGNLALFAAAGYGMVGRFPLPSADWWDYFDVPVGKRLPLLRAKYAADPEGLAVVEGMQVEIDMHRKYGEYYGYVFYVARKGRE